MGIRWNWTDPKTVELYNDTMVAPSSAAGALVQPPVEASSFEDMARAMGDAASLSDMDKMRMHVAEEGWTIPQFGTVKVTDKRKARKERAHKRRGLRQMDRLVKKGSPDAALLLEALIRNGTVVTDSNGDVWSPDVEGPRNSNKRLLQFIRDNMSNQRLMEVMDNYKVQRGDE